MLEKKKQCEAEEVTATIHQARLQSINSDVEWTVSRPRIIDPYEENASQSPDAQASEAGQFAQNFSLLVLISFYIIYFKYDRKITKSYVKNITNKGTRKWMTDAADENNEQKRIIMKHTTRFLFRFGTHPNSHLSCRLLVTTASLTEQTILESS